jgi:predicted P-loop ATPase
MPENVAATAVDLEFMVGGESPLYRPITVTQFHSASATDKFEFQIPLLGLAELIAETSNQTKANLPWLKLARFGDVKTTDGCLRHDANLLAITGIEADYDGEQVSLKEASDALKKAGVTSLLYTSPSHTSDKPRWRAVCPLSTERGPDQRHHLVSRLNGVLGGILAPESWRLSQSYYYGNVTGKPSCDVELIEGDYIDLRTDLDASAVGPNPSATTSPKAAFPSNAPQLGKYALSTACNLIINAEWSEQELTLNTESFKIGMHVEHNNLDLDTARAKLIAAGLKMLNQPGKGKWTEAVIATKVDHGLKDGIKKAKLSKASMEGAKTSDAEGWLAGVQRCKNGEPRPNLYNVMLALRTDPKLAGLFAYDQMRLTTIILHPVPGTPAKETFSPRPVTDADVAALQELLQTAGLETIGKDVVHQAVDLRAMERSFHPVRDYLDSLVWDGTPRLDKWVPTYLGAQNTPYHCSIGRMFLLSMVARIYEPGCQVDYMPVLEGEQGELKSSVCRALAGDEYFSDSLPPIGNDQVRLAQHLRGKWLIEIAEMSAMSRSESEDLKAFITRRAETYIAKYARKEATEPRQCVFVGSTNKHAYLRDETGGRRFWPIKIGQINLMALKQDRDQLFAEAVRAYKHGSKWWPDRDFEHKHIAPMQDARFEADAWEQPIAEWLEMKGRATVMEVANGALQLDTSRLNLADQRRIKSAMTRLKWVEGKRTESGRWWVPTSLRPPRRKLRLNRRSNRFAPQSPRQRLRKFWRPYE